MATLDPVRARTRSILAEDPASAQQHMLSQFYQGVKTYVDERLLEVLAERTSAPMARDIARAEVEDRFNAHAVNDEGMDLINESRASVMDLAIVWLDLLPAGRDKSLAYTALEEASFHATAAISRQKGNQS